jgi:hypothetical protein
VLGLVMAFWRLDGLDRDPAGMLNLSALSSSFPPGFLEPLAFLSSYPAGVSKLLSFLSNNPSGLSELFAVSAGPYSRFDNIVDVFVLRLNLNKDVKVKRRHGGLAKS